MISWWKNKKYLAYEGKNKGYIVRTLLSFVGDNYCLNTSGYTSSEDRRLLSSCRCEELIKNIEGIKLDLAIAEARIKANEATISEVGQEFHKRSNNSMNYQVKKPREEGSTERQIAL